MNRFFDCFLFFYLVTHEKNGIYTAFESEEPFDTEAECQSLANRLITGLEPRITQLGVEPIVFERPTPPNTISLLKSFYKKYRVRPHDAMGLLQTLYNDQRTTYPRTVSETFSFDTDENYKYVVAFCFYLFI